MKPSARLSSSWRASDRARTPSRRTLSSRWDVTYRIGRTGRRCPRRSAARGRARGGRRPAGASRPWPSRTAPPAGSPFRTPRRCAGGRPRHPRPRGAGPLPLSGTSGVVNGSTLSQRFRARPSRRSVGPNARTQSQSQLFQSKIGPRTKSVSIDARSVAQCTRSCAQRAVAALIDTLRRPIRGSLIQNCNARDGPRHGHGTRTRAG